MKYYTLEEVAVKLKTTPEDVLNIVTGKAITPSGESEMMLFPSVYFRSPVQVCRRVETKDDCYSVNEAVNGYFEVVGLFDANRDSRGYWELSFGGKSRVTLHRDGLQYFVKETKRVHESEFLVSDEELEHWMEMYGISGDQDLNPSGEPTDKIEWAKMFAEQERKTRKPLKLIAQDLLKQGISKYHIGLILRPDPEVGRSGYEKRADTLLGKRGNKEKLG